MNTEISQEIRDIVKQIANDKVEDYTSNLKLVAISEVYGDELKIDLVDSLTGIKKSFNVDVQLFNMYRDDELEGKIYRRDNKFIEILDNIGDSYHVVFFDEQDEPEVWNIAEIYAYILRNNLETEE